MKRESHCVMVVDDDSEIREGISDVLSDYGYQVVAACNGREALDQLRCTPDVCAIVLDMMMPVMDGVAFRGAQLLEPDFAGIPIIVVTAGPDWKEMGASLGAARCLKKPFTLDNLVRAVGDLC
jgi:two-component system chemotaxis response regulator CheY